MKTLAILLFSLVTVTALAETPDQIAADYRAKAKTALEKVNATLEKATVPIIAELVKAGDTTGADEVKAQLKAKQDGEPVMKPHAKAANLFTLYDAARLRAVEPIQQATIRKLDAVLAGADGMKLEIVDAVKTVRAEIEAGKIKTAFNWERAWALLPDKSGAAIGKITFNADGSALYVSKVGNKTLGNWEAGTKGNSIKVTFPADEWMVTAKQSGVEFTSKTLPQIAYLIPEQ